MKSHDIRSKWKIAETQGRNNLLEIQLEEANRLVKLTQTKENCMQEECSLLHGMIAELQVTIQKQYDVRDENEHFKKCIQDLEKKLRIAEQEQKEHIEKLLLEMKTMEQEHKVECVKIQQDMSRKFEIKEAELKEIIDKKETEIQLLNRQLCSQEREKQNEIIKLQMEFNTKLVKIQSTSIKSPHQDSSALPQNIFKRKLQHLQEEKNREIAALRRTIRELEQQQDCNQGSYVKRRRF
ncbi:coiled-coil domain-containing protein 152 [Rhincodon typus]|uniref:coiled-coil domain-containing protein 152 n=1 Tax=Rhincodon typus TaxID=259920 RepID=UPI0020302F37|nr:coiled-coil domain-containing protein 152 [Rhincodon typus]